MRVIRHGIFNNSLFFIALLCAASLFLSGCSNTKAIEKIHPSPQADLGLDEQYYQVDITSFDGTQLRATIYQPTLKRGETAPLILHTHGFGVSRVSSPRSVYTNFLITAKTAIAAWHKGYWVISIDQRGFGQSGGNVNAMDPEIEVKDAIAVIDWAAKNLPQLRYDDTKRKDPRVGMVGESYGGAVQLLASIQDARIDALIPVTTWYNLSDSLAPGGHIKSFWGAALVGAGAVGSGFDLGPMLKSPFIKSATGSLRPGAQRTLYEHSPAFFCERGQYPQADTLLIQGFHDTLFPANEAWHNKRCIEKNQRDVRLLVLQGGHMLPTQQWLGKVPFYNLEDKIHCEDKTLHMVDIMLNWYDAKLRDAPEKPNTIPKLCLTQDRDSGIVTTSLHTGGEILHVPSHSVRPGFSGSFEMILRPMDRLLAIPKSLFRKKNDDKQALAQLKSQGGFIRPAFIPLKAIDQKGVMTGIPTARLTVDSHNDDVVVFVGIAVKSKNGSVLKLSSEQIEPLRGTGVHRVELPAVSYRMQAGDVIGLVVSGTNGQYFLNRSLIPMETNISGEVRLPLFKKEKNTYIAYNCSAATPCANDGTYYADQQNDTSTTTALADEKQLPLIDELLPE